MATIAGDDVVVRHEGPPRSDPEELRLREEIDREVSDTGGLIPLVLCLMVALGLLAAGAFTLLPA